MHPILAGQIQEQKFLVYLSIIVENSLAEHTQAET